MTVLATPACYRFGQFELQPRERRLLAGGAPVDIASRTFDLLVALVERGGQLNTKDELLARVWPRLIVEESNLHVQVSALRKVLGAESIATVPGHGYRFNLEVTAVEAHLPTAVPVPENNLPRQLTSFIGREKEIVEIKMLLGKTRLLTLTGSGGSGKTRLAMEVAKDLLGTYRDGIWLAELADLADPMLVPQTVATILGLREAAGRSLTQTLTEHFESRHLLLILDNAEHLLATCAKLADAVLRCAAQVVVLVTSRERLGMVGELTYRVPSLTTPDARGDVTPERLARYESVRLFIERARSHRPDFTLNQQNAAALASVCSRLDGIPLALELAAAQMRSMAVGEINVRLDQRFRLLTKGSRTALPRQQTLRALIDWSHDLLHPTEQILFRRLAAFAGGWTLDAAERACSGDGLDAEMVLEILTALADKSLVQFNERTAASRYAMLETVRQYAREKLRERSEEAEWQSRHAAYYVQLGVEAGQYLRSPDQQRWLDCLEIDHENLRAVLSWSSANKDASTNGLRLAGSLFRFWLVRGHFGEGRRWLVSLLACSPGNRSATRAKALTGAGGLAWQQGDYMAARSHYEEGLAICRELGDQQGTCAALNNLGNVAYERGDYSAARELHSASLTMVRELGDRRGIAISLNNLGNIASDEGDHGAARALYEESLWIRRELDDKFGVAATLSNLGIVAYSSRDNSTARTLYEESLAIRRDLGDRFGVAVSLTNLGILACDDRDFSIALAFHEEALAIETDLGDLRGIAESLEGFAEVAFALAEYGRAARLWGSAQRLRDDIGAPLPPKDRRDYDCKVAATLTAIGDDAAFNKAWQEGRTMTRQAVVKFALQMQDS